MPGAGFAGASARLPIKKPVEWRGSKALAGPSNRMTSSDMAGKSKKTSQDVDFEKALSDLEALVTRMESGDLTLEESLKAFEEGVRLTRDCQQRLTEAEQRVQLLVEEQGEIATTDLAEESDPE